MATIQNYEYCYPNCLPPPPHFFSPPHPNVMPPPPPHHFSPPSPPHHFSPPPPHHHLFPPPPPPHVLPPPPPPPGHHSTVIIIIFVFLGSLFFLAFLSVALCCFIKKKQRAIQETDIVRIDEQVKIKEAIVPGPHGPEAVILSIDEDVHIEEVVKKNEMVSTGMHMMSGEEHHRPGAFRNANSESEGGGVHIEHDKK